MQTLFHLPLISNDLVSWILGISFFLLLAHIGNWIFFGRSRKVSDDSLTTPVQGWEPGPDLVYDGHRHRLPKLDQVCDLFVASHRHGLRHSTVESRNDQAVCLPGGHFHMHLFVDPEEATTGGICLPWDERRRQDHRHDSGASIVDFGIEKPAIDPSEAGLLLIGISILKMYFHDLESLKNIYRVLSLVGIGLRDGGSTLYLKAQSNMAQVAARMKN